MRALRSVLVILFAVVGALALLDFCLSFRRNFPLTGSFHPLLLVAAAILPVSSTLFLLAAIAYWKRWRFARALNLLLGSFNLIGPFVLAAFMASRGYDSFSANLSMNGLLLGLGAVILFAFWRWDPIAEKKAHDPSVTAAQPGDGTISFLNRIYFFADAALFWVIYDLWSRWAWKTGLFRPGWMAGTFDLILGAVVAVALHELGHTLCGLVLGQKLLAFYAGPFQWRFHRGRWQFLFNPIGLLTTGGGTATVPQRLDEPQGHEFSMIVAGPAVSLLAGMAGLWAALTVIGTSHEILWFPLAMFGSISLQAAVTNLIPLRTATGYSDGARILQILRGGVWADLDHVFRTSAATVVTPLRPRDYDINALHRVIAARIVPQPQQLLLHLLAKSYYIDHDAPGEVHNEMLQALTIYNDCAPSIPAELHYSFILEAALFRRDAAQARLWWDRMEAKKPTCLNGDYWMARSALCWLEGKPDEAHAAWAKAHAYLATMPCTGTYEFDRDILARIEHTIHPDPHGETPASSPHPEPVFAV
jgi:hypothetical protein